jgi:AcrR family transcriptional regulator
MVTSYSPPLAPRIDRRGRRRQETINEALDHAMVIMTEAGVGGLSISEMARRMGIRAPSLYKYFHSLHGVYDLLFGRALRESWEAIERATVDMNGVARVAAGTRSLIAWSVEHPALAQLLFWRPVPGFEPSPQTFAGSVDQMQNLQAELALAVGAGELSEGADSDEAVRMLTVIMSGLISQQLANEPHVSYADGRFTQLTDQALDMFFNHYRIPTQISPEPRRNHARTDH